MNETLNVLAGVVHSPYNPNTPYAPTDYRALANAYIHNAQNQREQQYMNVPQNYSYEGGLYTPPNQSFKPSVNDQISGFVDYLQSPYVPTDPMNRQQMRYAGTPRYQQWVDGLTMTPREVALGSQSAYPADIRAMSIYGGR